MQKNDYDFANDIRKATEQAGSKSAWMFLFLIILILSSFLYWASISYIEQGAVGIGRVIPSSQTQLVENLDAGIVREILVREGDLVEPGDVLVKMENTGDSLRRLSAHLFASLSFSEILVYLKFEQQVKLQILCKKFYELVIPRFLKYESMSVRPSFVYFNF